MSTTRPVSTYSSRGQLHYQMLLGEHDSDPGQVALPRTWFGLPWSAIYLYGSLRDEEGELYTVLRAPEYSGGGRKRFFLQSTLDGAQDLKVHAASRNSARSTGFVRTHTNGTTSLVSAPDSEGDAFTFTVDSTTSRWTEGAVIDLRGTLVEPGLHWHLPHAEDGYYYVSQLYDVEGEILGRKVRGFYGADDMYMHGLCYQDDLLIGRRLHVAWYTWATRYVDGSLDGGHFMLGHDGLGMLLLCDETGAVRRTTNVTGHVEVDGTGLWPRRIEVHAPGEDWEFLPDPRGRMVDFMPMPNPQTEGRWRRIGDTREPSHWFAYGEIAPSHGLTPRRYEDPV
ncbi:hypothetical protein ACAG24_023545 [Mycobacterium sp. pW049]|uniref:hypothetical protein n=1 Tax=[Mycobacterium] bulgaricum TaxID=3238985 RepID=UPI00351B7856